MRARAMQRALWPATIGYWMDKLLTPVFSDDAIANTRAGSSPTTSAAAAPCRRSASAASPTASCRPRHSRASAGSTRQQHGVFGDPQLPFLRALLAVLRAVDADWTAMAANNAHVGQDRATPTRLLLDVVGLHPSSVEYYSRYSREPERAVQRRQPLGLRPGLRAAPLDALALHAAAAGLLGRLGYTRHGQPDILQHYLPDATPTRSRP